ncbi:MAG: ferritin-like domain-containing protein [Thermomicrobiales bacterium]
MALETPRDLFVHELSDTMSAEHIVLRMLDDLEAESGNEDVKAAVKHHQGETTQQIKNLEKVFKLLGEKPEETTCHAAEGLKKEHDSLKEEDPSPLVLEVGNLAGAGSRQSRRCCQDRALRDGQLYHAYPDGQGSRRVGCR